VPELFRHFWTCKHTVSALLALQTKVPELFRHFWTCKHTVSALLALQTKVTELFRHFSGTLGPASKGARTVPALSWHSWTCKQTVPPLFRQFWTGAGIVLALLVLQAKVLE
jgi:hypothetical protein